MDSQRDAGAALEQFRLHGWRETGRELGRGSYAAVVEVDYKGLKCAGKKIYRVLYEQGVGNLVTRFEKECRLLSQLRHPHVVQFLGIYFDPDSSLPVLVMEFLPTTLAQCLDTYGVLPEEINYGILQDVALGLRYLHERPEPIVHRDLSANNVLLTGDMRGKISDLGVAKILGLSAAQLSRMTQGPGTPAYMPPEATAARPRYDIKVDIFSYGVMMVHILSGRWPIPGEPVRVNPDNPADLTPVSEVGRRQEYITDIAQDHPLLELIRCCLSNSSAHRPDASYVAAQVSEAASKCPPSFSNKVEMLERIRVDAEQREALKEENQRLTREGEVAITNEATLMGQVEQLHRQLADCQADIHSKQSELSVLQQRWAASKDITSEKEEVITDLRDQLRRTRTHLASNQQPNLLITPGAKLVWKECAELPYAMRLAQAVVIDEVVYVGSGGEGGGNAVCRYHPREDKWDTLPGALVTQFGIGQVSGQLVLVGGRRRSSNEITGDVYTFVSTSQEQGWVKSIPAMPTARYGVSVVSHSTVLIACGGGADKPGRDGEKIPVPTVELYSSETSHWYQCPPLPYQRKWLSSATVGDTLFLTGGVNLGSEETPKRYLFLASISALIEQAMSRSGSVSKVSLWKTVKNVPNSFPALAYAGGCLLALGGGWFTCTKAIHTYVSAYSTWHQIGELPLALQKATAVALPTGEVLVIGGGNKQWTRTDFVFKGTVEV